MAELLTKKKKLAMDRKKKLAMDRERKLMDLVVRVLMARGQSSTINITANEMNAVLHRPTYYLLKEDFSIDVTMEDDHADSQ